MAKNKDKPKKKPSAFSNLTRKLGQVAKGAPKHVLNFLTVLTAFMPAVDPIAYHLPRGDLVSMFKGIAVNYGVTPQGVNIPFMLGKIAPPVTLQTIKKGGSALGVW